MKKSRIEDQTDSVKPAYPAVHSPEIVQRAEALLEKLSVKRTVTLKEVSPDDREEAYPLGTPKWKKRFFEVIPGLFTWFFILAPIAVALLGIPQVLVLYIAYLTVYWMFRALGFIYGLWEGNNRMKADMATDWIGKIQAEFPEKYEKIKYVYLDPILHESLDTLEPSLKAWSLSDVDTKKISVVAAIEEKFALQMLERFEHLKEKYGDKFREFKYYIHPGNIEGEVHGVKGGNINWAAREFVKEVEARGEDLKDYLLFTCDSDLQPHPKYISAITYKFFIDPKPLRKFYASAVHTFNNNLWRVPFLIRVFSTTLTLVVLHNWVIAKKYRETWSAYAMSLQTLKDVKFWCPDMENDDTAFYWNAIVRFEGDFAGEEVYIPTYNDAVENETMIKSHQSLYKQQHRWGWGIIVFPTSLAGITANKAFTLENKLKALWTLFDNQLLFLTVVYLLTFGLPILNLVSKEFVNSSASYNLPSLMSSVLSGIMLLNIPVIFFRRKLSPIPKNWPWWRYVLDFVETFLITVNMLTFGFLPYVQAQTELLFGVKMKRKFYATERKAIVKGSTAKG
jgi:hypothetical protein